PQNRKNRALMRHSPPRIRPRRLDRRTPSLLPLRRFHRIPPETATRPTPEEQSQTATMGRPDHHRYAPTHHLHPVLQCSPTHETATHQPYERPSSPSDTIQPLLTDPPSRHPPHDREPGNTGDSGHLP